ncbi:TRM11 family SAM-dependent methyltransferase [Alteribacter aurantiacus]|uniref:TRM11 family SAM-dependent methyltransferase n=1 Tax=Alteribacter aurantiacus TaxID=254410 RepID=UPI000407878C|nr:methyltransferase domain-containing protein [Alteribacter aurantiacus]
MNDQKTYLYLFRYTEEEQPLCKMEMRAFFGFDTNSHNIKTPIEVDPNRSPFMSERIEVWFEDKTIEGIINKVACLGETGKTFKLSYVKNRDEKGVSFQEAKVLERKVGLNIKGKANLSNPHDHYGLYYDKGVWYFGKLVYSKLNSAQHQNKPHEYSTALSTHIARSIVNIAVPKTEGIKVIDPCCGIGTVLIEACSMGVSITGSDVNPKVMYGSRKNLAHFGYDCKVSLQDIKDVTEEYDVAIIDMPYNLCSVLDPKDQLEMLKSARRFAHRVVIVTIEPIDEAISQAGLIINDRCVFRKNGRFKREVMVCSSKY